MFNRKSGGLDKSVHLRAITVDYLLVGIVFQDELLKEEERPLVVHLAETATVRVRARVLRTSSCTLRSPFAEAAQQIARYLWPQHGGNFRT